MVAACSLLLQSCSPAHFHCALPCSPALSLRVPGPLPSTRLLRWLNRLLLLSHDECADRAVMYANRKVALGAKHTVFFAVTPNPSVLWNVMLNFRPGAGAGNMVRRAARCGEAGEESRLGAGAEESTEEDARRRGDKGGQRHQGRGEVGAGGERRGERERKGGKSGGSRGKVGVGHAATTS